MPSELSTIGDVSLGLIVKRVKGKLYVYEYVRVNGRAVEKYIGPLEEIVRTYQALKAQITVIGRVRTKDLRPLAQYIADNLMENLKEAWSRGRDLNPGPPPYQGGALPS